MELTTATRAQIEAALEEDLGRGDLTSELIFGPGTTARGAIVAKQPLVVAGVAVARAVFERACPTLAFAARAADGDALERGGVVAVVEGDARALLGAE